MRSSPLVPIPPFSRPAAPIACVLAILVCGATANVGCGPAAPLHATASSSTQTTPPAAGSAEAPTALRLSGTVEAVRSRSVTVPRLAGQNLNVLVITYLVKSGARVKPGDVLVEFDRQEQERAALDRRAELVDLDGQIDRRRAELASVKARDETEMKSAEHDVERARLEIRKNELLAKVEAEKNNLALEQAQARLDQLKTTFALKRKAADADIKILEIRRERMERTMKNTERNAELMEVRAPFGGLAVLKMISRPTSQSEVQQGDEVRPGQAVLDIVDTSAMQVRAKMNQADVELIRPGQRAIVRLDGYPELKFDGKIETVAPLGVPSNMSPMVRTFVAVISIRGTHPQLMPDLTASVEIAAPPPPTVQVRR